MENNLSDLYLKLGKLEYELINLKNRMTELIESKNSILEQIYMQENHIPEINVDDKSKLDFLNNAI